MELAYTLRMSELIIWLGAGIALVAALIILLGYVAYHLMIRYRMRDEAYQRQAGLESGDFDASVFDLPWIEEDVVSPGGYVLRAHSLEPEAAPGAAANGAPASGRKLAVFHHGIGWGWIGMIRYMELFRAEGWTVVAYDSRGHGAAGSAAESGGLRPSYGYYEKEDLKAIVDYAIRRFGGGGGGGGSGAASGVRGGAGGRGAKPALAVFGESMGAATVLQYAPLDPRVDAVIADCPFSSAMGELDYRLKTAMVPPGLRALVERVADAFCRRLEGFSLRDADPARAVLETEVPILFVHGLEDRYVPWRMSVVMAERRRRALPEAVTELLLVPGARHAACIRADRARYASALRGFLAKAIG
jgi:alpha-beta hydrolase superfamily lysophospholipase